MHTISHDRLKELAQGEHARRLSAPAQERLAWIVRYLAEGESASEICARLNMSRSTFHRWLDRFDPENLLTLEEQSREPHHLRSSNVSRETADLIRDYRTKSPHIGKEKIAEMLEIHHKIELSSSTIGRIIERDCLYFGATPLHWKKRMNWGNAKSETRNTKTDLIDTPLASAPCDCFWCRVRARKHVRRTILIGSIVSNVALIALVTGTLFWEKKSETLRAAATDTDIQSITTSYSLEEK